MKPRLRQLVLTTHILGSVGWLGAVAAFLVLAVLGYSHQDVFAKRAAYLSMDVVTRLLIVPLAFASLVSGLVVSLGSAWGLLRHYWVVAKLLITVLACALLLLHLEPIARLSAMARSGAELGEAADRIGRKLITNSALALLALSVNTALSVFKPWGKTRRGLRSRRAAPVQPAVPRPASVVPEDAPTGSTPRWVYVVAVHVVGLGVLGLAMHIAGGGVHH